MQIHASNIHLPPQATQAPAAAADREQHRAQREAANTAVSEHGVATGEIDRAKLEQIRALKNRDREVRQHEQAHAAAAAGVPHSAPSYSFTRGPDGQMYATAGEVRIDVSPVAGDPAATLRKARQIQRAALAPAEPSAADRAVAAQAAAMAAAASAEIAATDPDQESAEAADVARSELSENQPSASHQAEPADGQCAVCGGGHSAGQHLETSYAPQDGDHEHTTLIDLHA